MILGASFLMLEISVIIIALPISFETQLLGQGRRNGTCPLTSTHTLSLISLPHASSVGRFHIARKKIPYFDPATDVVVQPEAPNGIKLEQFIFDVFESVDPTAFVTVEVLGCAKL